ncbi:unnamed protein product, partial [Hapterophycus canaliculatus]
MCNTYLSPSPPPHRPEKTKVNVKQCNVDVLEREALAVSDPDSPRYGQHLSAREACEVTMCPEHTAGVRAILRWVLGGPQRPIWTEEEG